MYTKQQIETLNFLPETSKQFHEKVFTEIKLRVFVFFNGTKQEVLIESKFVELNGWQKVENKEFPNLEKAMEFTKEYVERQIKTSKTRK